MSFALAEGAVFAGRYRLGRVIGVGGMGAVYEAVHLETNRRRALKIMHPTLFESPNLRERFQREAKIAADVESEFIVEVFDAGIDEQTRMPFLVMELLRGEDLDHRIERLGRLSAHEVVTYLHQAALALDRTHKAAIVHRDLKPENIFLTQREDGQPRVKILDFGIAKLVAETSSAGRATHGVGTPIYMAPEQFDGSALSGATDVYALGLVAYTLLVGASYWVKEERTGNLLAILAAASRGKPEPASARAAASGVALPPAFDAWFDRATAMRPEERFQVATHAVRALAEALEVAPPPSAARPPDWMAELATRPTVASVPAGTPLQVAPDPRDEPDKTPASSGSARVDLSAARADLGDPRAASEGAARGSVPAGAPSRVGRVAGIALALGVGALLGAVVYATQIDRTPEPGTAPAGTDTAGMPASASVAPAAEPRTSPAVTPGIAPLGSAAATPGVEPVGAAPAATERSPGAAAAAPAPDAASTARSPNAAAALPPGAPAARSPGAASAAPSPGGPGALPPGASSGAQGAQPPAGSSTANAKKRWTRD
ncbi:protein kinase domain-containing protein [Sorangium sp. So ce1389]|uniref:serine/threonine-protein kinase n=1 Tax=Sorangium sp. So ce1389 TaxID=3133336 RepID=UPI003F5E696B